MDKDTLRKADLVFSLALAGLSVAAFANSLMMFLNPFGRPFRLLKAEEIRQNLLNWHQSPALFPAFLSIVLLILAVVLLNFALLEGARIDFLRLGKIKQFLMSRELHVSSFILLSLCLYAFVVIPLCRKHLDFYPRFQGFPFMVATFIYLIGTMLAFNKRTKRALVTSLVISSSAAVLITLGFGKLALIPLP